MAAPIAGARDITVLIPAAGRVPEGALVLSNISCPAMIPVAGRPVIHWTLSYLRSLGLERFRVAVARHGMFIEDFVAVSFGRECDVEFMVPSVDGGVGRTVLELLEGVTTSSALIVLGDTYFQFADPAVFGGASPFVLLHPVDESYRWCLAETAPDGSLERLRDKEPGLTGPLQALIGVYYFPDVEVARKAAREAAADAATAGRDRLELAPILERVHAAAGLRGVLAGDWLDCGNPDRLAASRRTLLQKRPFNELSIDSVFGTVTKRSRHVEKFIDEIDFLRQLPDELAVMFPRVLGCSTDPADPWLTMEYYGYPTLAEILVFENVDAAVWEQIFAHLHEILTRGFGRARRPLPGALLRDMYVDKTRERLEAMRGPEALVALVRHPGPIEINGRRVPNLSAQWPRIETAVARMAEGAEATVVHGDLCLSNILYDLRARVCKLLDPRGRFGVAGIFGDPRYDVAKLYQCVYGLYDFIMSDLFEVAVDGARVRLAIHAAARHAQIRERFERVFFTRFHREEILLVTALLFASMPALHYEAPRRQLAMYARALELLDEALG
jgi:dTDP-glucose pyrophosphorylase